MSFSTVLETTGDIVPSGSVRAGTGWALEWKRPDGTIRTVTLKPGKNVVGRSSRCDVTIDDASISREHAALTVGAGGVTVKDLGGAGRVQVDGRPVSGETVVRAGATVVLGMVATHLVASTGEAKE
jgi:pSer/pThr/pTyr-binding forkhead associated (FHA) protein